MLRTSRVSSAGILALGIAGAMLLYAGPASANTYHVGVHGGGHVVSGPVGHTGAVVRVHGPGAGPYVRGPVYAPQVRRGGGFYRPWHRGYGYGYGYGYAYYYNPYYYSYGYYDPYATGYYAAPVAVAAPYAGGVMATARQHEPTVGVGIRGSSVRAGEDRPAAEGLGALLRFRSRPVELELEVGWDHYGSDTDRTDTRVATSLYVPIAGHAIQPYLVVGAGMNFAHFGGTGDDLHQGFLAGGGGLALNFSRSFTIAADARYMVREFFDDMTLVAKQPIMVDPTISPDKHDEAVEFRANAIIYF
jgi:hypothetical protein